MTHGPGVVAIGAAAVPAALVFAEDWPVCISERFRVCLRIDDQMKTTTEESITSRWAVTASQMQCPRHQRNARLELEGDQLDELEIEVFTCCGDFAKRVHDALRGAGPRA